MGHGVGPIVYAGGPCNVVTSGCAEAYSVTRAMVTSYAGPLFQLYNGSSTLDIGQVNHVADMSTWSAFCSGAASNCKFSKIYAQVNSANDLVPSVFNAPFGPDCSVGGAYICAAPFAIETATGLPIIRTTAPQEYTIAADASATGVTGGHNAMSVMYNGQPLLTTTYCCGVFGLAHKYNASDTEGTDFLIGLAYGNGGFNNCGTSYCAGAEEELVFDLSNYSTTLWANAVVLITYNAGSNIVSAWINNTSLFSQTPASSSITAGTSVHLGGGGDLSQPAPATVREMFITNTTMSSGDQSAAFNNMKAFYGTLVFP